MTPPPLTRRQLAALIDPTLQRPEATAHDVAALCEEAAALGVYSVCVSAARVRDAAAHLGGAEVRVGSVVGFPSGAHRAELTRAEAERAVQDGADEIDMVIDLGLAHAGDWAAVAREVGEVRAGIGTTRILKVIIEAATLDEAAVTAACGAAEQGGADFVKSSTGFHPAGGAALGTIRRMAETVGGRLGVKASGGIQTTETALAMVAAGATRLGMSRTASVLEGLS